MKRINLIAAVGALLFVASSAMAQVNPPAWFNTQGPNDTALCLEFNSASTVNQASILWNPFGSPTMSFNNLYFQNTLTNHQGMVGVIPGETATMDIFIPNRHDSSRMKLFWIQADYYVDGDSSLPAFLTTPGGEQIVFTSVVNVDAGGGWIRQTAEGFILPQPESETLSFQFFGGTPGASNGAWLDNLCVGTICVPVPEPGSLAVLGLGVLAFTRRRRK